MTEKARRRVEEENPIQAFKCHMQGAGVGTLKGEDSQCLPGLEVKDGDAEMIQSFRYKGLGSQPGITSQNRQIKVLGQLCIDTELCTSSWKGKKVKKKHTHTQIVGRSLGNITN